MKEGGGFFFKKNQMFVICNSFTYYANYCCKENTTKLTSCMCQMSHNFLFDKNHILL